MHQSILRRGMALSCLLGLAVAGGLSVRAAQPVYSLDVRNHIITIHPDANPTAEINAAMAYLITRPDKTTKWTVKFDGGQYLLTGHIYADNLQNVNLVSDRPNPAILRKAPGFANEYLFYSRFSKNISISGFQFYGKTPVFDPAMETNLSHPAWSDQGLYFASSNGITIDKNRFQDFGNAALRITTSESDPVRGVDSFNSTVTNNLFRNDYQITTTSNSLINGASANLLFQNNNIYDLHGSLKFASRTPGALNVWVRGNTIDGSSRDGIEISSYSNVEVSYNRLLNITRQAVNCYTNLRAVPGFQWGDNITFTGNVIDKAGTGFRFDSTAYESGFKAIPRNVQFINNTISNLKGSGPAISIVNGAIQGVTIQGNRMSGIASRQYINVPAGSSSVKISGNIADGRPYSN